MTIPHPLSWRRRVMRAFTHYETALQRVGCTLRPRGLELPEDLNFEDWATVGRTLDEFAQSSQWLIGDWWAFGEHRYGCRKALVDGGDWQGPSPQSCMDAASVCRQFAETSRRREVLSFSHHREVAALPRGEADALLDWCEEPLRAGERLPRSTRELRDEKRRRQGASITVLARVSGGSEPKVVRVAARVIPNPREPTIVRVRVRRDPIEWLADAMKDALRADELSPQTAIAAIIDVTDQVLATSEVDVSLRAKLLLLRQALAGSSGQASAA
jgi:hypothetical protein